MRTVAWETLSQIALRDCSEEVRGVLNIYINDFGEVRYIQSSTHFGIRSLLVTRSLQPVVRSKSLLVILMFF